MDAHHQELYYDALERCYKRYFYMSQGLPVHDFVLEFGQACRDSKPLMKLNRWLGYIQGTLIAAELTTVTAERDWTRPLFRPIDFKE